ncbi:MAG: CBS domain-containing protein [Candidatus Methanomethylicaceae archaeon]|jgi:CBS domain-containing protein
MVRDLMQSPVKVINRVDTLSHARKTMMKEHLSRLIVVEGTKPVGTLTRRDIVRGINDYRMRQRELDTIVVDEVMRSPVSTTTETESVADAARKMVSQNVRGLPVVDLAGELIGIVTKTDLTRYFSENFTGKLKVGDICQNKENTPIIHPTQSVSRAMDLMQDCSTDRVVVVDGEKPVGIITETDLSNIRTHSGGGSFVKGSVRDSEAVSQTRIYIKPTAEDIMTKTLQVVASTKDAAQAARMLISREIGGMPVVSREGNLVGMVTKFDFVKVIAKEEK